MTVARLELCQQIQVIFGWTGTQNVWATPAGPDRFSPYVRERAGDSYAYREVPAFDADFLLQKLAEHVSVEVRYVHPDQPMAIDLKEWYGKYTACTPYLRQGEYPYDDRAADALAELAILLWKRGELQRSDA